MGVVVGGGLDQLVVQVWVVTHVGAGVGVGVGFTELPGGGFPASGAVVRTPPVALRWLPSPLVPALATGLAASLLGIAGCGVPVPDGALDSGISGFAGRLASL